MEETAHHPQIGTSRNVSRVMSLHQITLSQTEGVVDGVDSATPSIKQNIIKAIRQEGMGRVMVFYAESFQEVHALSYAMNTVGYKVIYKGGKGYVLENKDGEEVTDGHRKYLDFLEVAKTFYDRAKEGVTTNERT